MPPMTVPMMQPVRSESYGRSPTAQPACSSASSAAARASWVKRSVRRTSLRERRSAGSKSVQTPAPSSMPESPAHQRTCRAPASAPSGVTAPTPVMTTRLSIRLLRARPLGDEVDGVADGLHLGHVLALDLDAVLLLDDLAEFDEVERVDVEGLEGRLEGDVVRLGAELLERLEDARLDGFAGDSGFGHGCFSLVWG